MKFGVGEKKKKNEKKMHSSTSIHEAHRGLDEITSRTLRPQRKANRIVDPGEKQSTINVDNRPRTAGQCVASICVAERKLCDEAKKE